MNATIAVSKPKISKSPVKITIRKSRAAVKVTAPPEVTVPKVSAKIDPNNKRSMLIEHLNAGATMEQMIALTGWQAHTVRGTISGVLRKKLGLNVVCEKSINSGSSFYRIVSTEVTA